MIAFIVISMIAAALLLVGVCVSVGRTRRSE